MAKSSAPRIVRFRAKTTVQPAPSYVERGARAKYTTADVVTQADLDALPQHNQAQFQQLTDVEVQAYLAKNGRAVLTEAEAKATAAATPATTSSASTTTSKTSDS